MPTALPTLVSASGNLALDVPRPQARATTPKTSFSRTLSEKRRAAPDPQPRETDPGPAAGPSARPAEPTRPSVPEANPARDARPTDMAADTAQATDKDAQGLPARAASAAGDRSAGPVSARNSETQSPLNEQAVSEAVVAAQQAASGVLEPGALSPLENQQGTVQQPPAPAATPAQGALAPQAPAGPGLHFDAALHTSGTAASIQVTAPLDGAGNAGGEQTHSHGQSNASTSSDGSRQELKASAGVESGKGFQGASEQTASGNPALGRAMQVQSAVHIENITGHAPITPSATTNGISASTAAAAEGQAFARAENGSQDQPHQMIGRVVRGLSAMINQRGGVMNMRLQPPELGQLRVQMTIARGVVSAQFQPASAEAQALLDRSMGTLRTALEAHGLSVERLSVQGPQQTGGPSTRDAAEDQTQQQRHHHDAGHGQSRGRHDGHDDAASHRTSYQADQEFTMPQPAVPAAGADEP
jgi:flagellar hook-length control protein FliK